METYKINLNSPINYDIELSVDKIQKKNGAFIMTLSRGTTYESLKVGQVIVYGRKLYTGENTYTYINEYGHIIAKSDNKIAVTIPKTKVYSIKDFKTIRENEYRIKLDRPHNIFQQDIESIDDYRMTFYDINRDIIASGVTDFFIPLKYEDRALTSGDCLTLVDKVTLCDGNCDGVQNVYDYIFLPENVSRDSVMVVDTNSAITSAFVESVKYVSFSYNPYFYYRKEKKDIVSYSDTWLDIIKELSENECNLYLANDTKIYISVVDGYYKIDLGLSSDLNEKGLGIEDSMGTSFVDSIKESLIPEFVDMERIKYIPAVKLPGSSDNKHFLWHTPNGYEKCSTYEDIYTSTIDFEIGEIGVENIKVINENGDFNNYPLETGLEFRFDYEYGEVFPGGVMPTIYKTWIDGSQVRDCTYYLTNEIICGGLQPLHEINFYLHFIKRAKVKDEEDAKVMNSSSTTGNTYYDTWHIDDDENEITWWNEYNYSGTTFDVDSFQEFYEKNGKMSDLMGYLNFTNNDIYYRKKKVSKSFLRLSFYDSTDPITQKLLYYSTIFLDDGELYGNYLKQLSNFKMDDEDGMTAIYENKNTYVVDFSGGTRVDSKIKVTNEYDRTKSSEGFNIYLFAEDKTFELENGEKTIYMRVEFNHAGNGKTIPMIAWPKDKNGNYCSLTTKNFIDSLYIPVKIAYINNRYIYYFEDCEYEDNGKGMSLVLFEPKLDTIDIDGVKDNEP